MHRSVFPVLAAAIALAGCNKDPASPVASSQPPAASPAAPQAPTTPDIDPLVLAMFAPLPATLEAKDNPITEEKIVLGRMLYFDARLSKNRDVSCNTCHDLAGFGVDGKPVSKGHRGQPGTRNSPTVYNAAGRFAQFWDGRAATVEEQAKGPMLNPVEMAMPNDKRVAATLKTIPQYVELFRKAFPGDKDPVTFDNAARAIGAFERRLLTPSRWDKYLAGDKSTLTPEEKAGATKFVTAGCTACHSGALVGGAMFQKLGLMKPWPDTKDRGRFEVTKAEADQMMFAVPSLRNVTRTAPYFHDGSVATLEEAVNKMAEYELGRPLPAEDNKAIVAWLGSLTGELPADYIKKPELPPDGPKTPKADPR